jgi:hypothetical protein
MKTFIAKIEASSLIHKSVSVECGGEVAWLSTWKQKQALSSTVCTELSEIWTDEILL